MFISNVSNWVLVEYVSLLFSNRFHISSLNVFYISFPHGIAYSVEQKMYTLCNTSKIVDTRLQ